MKTQPANTNTRPEYPQGRNCEHCKKRFIAEHIEAVLCRECFTAYCRRAERFERMESFGYARD